VAQLLRAYKDYRGMYEGIFYWAPSGQISHEVDFILVRGPNLIAIEAKSGKNFRKDWCKGLRAIASLEGLIRRIVVYPKGPLMETEDGNAVMSFRHFADELATGTLWG
jgi:predicted AAA+ superfamily ATPase